MSACATRVRVDRARIADLAVDMAVDVVGQSLATRAGFVDDQLRALVADVAQAQAIIDLARHHRTIALEDAARLGFFLGLTTANQGEMSDCAWLGEALRLAGIEADIADRSNPSATGPAELATQPGLSTTSKPSAPGLANKHTSEEASLEATRV